MPVLSTDQTTTMLIIVFTTLFVHSLGLLTGLLVRSPRQAKPVLVAKPPVKPPVVMQKVKANEK